MAGQFSAAFWAAVYFFFWVPLSLVLRLAGRCMTHGGASPVAGSPWKVRSGDGRRARRSGRGRGVERVEGGCVTLPGRVRPGLLKLTRAD